MGLQNKKKKSIHKLLEFSILNIDKPTGPTSFNISDLVRKKFKEFGFNVRKTSHFGTLDPKVTGVLPIAINRACKLTGYFIGHDKEYVGIMRLHKKVEMKKIQEIIKKRFIGKIKQTPPVRSRVKRQEREREIKKFELLEQDDKDILFRVKCEGGTYIRKLIDDLGKELGIGAHMLELRRVRAGIFSESNENFVDLYKFENSLKNEKLLREILIPAEEAVKKVYKIVQIKKDNLEKILTGKPIHKKDLVKKEKIILGEIIGVFCNERFVGMYEVINQKEIFAKSKFVMQEVGG